MASGVAELYFVLAQALKPAAEDQKEGALCLDKPLGWWELARPKRKLRTLRAQPATVFFR
jgi:hypothetical protein